MSLARPLQPEDVSAAAASASPLLIAPPSEDWATLSVPTLLLCFRRNLAQPLHYSPSLDALFLSFSFLTRLICYLPWASFRTCGISLVDPLALVFLLVGPAITRPPYPPAASLRRSTSDPISPCRLLPFLSRISAYFAPYTPPRRLSGFCFILLLSTKGTRSTTTAGEERLVYTRPVRGTLLLFIFIHFYSFCSFLFVYVLFSLLSLLSSAFSLQSDCAEIRYFRGQ